MTFDVEDFINEGSIRSLHRILKLLRKNLLRGLFFITGSMAEKISHYHEILELLNDHEIGYHSSSHSVRPTILEFTDVKSYDEAIKISLKRETSHIDSISGNTGEKGGILALRELFPEKSIVCYRAPQLCWTPPHLEALRKLGFKFDFSTCISDVPIFYKGITFYPYPIWIDRITNRIGIFLSTHPTDSYIRFLIISILRKKITVLALHHYRLMYSQWDHFYMQKKKPKKLLYADAYNPVKVKMQFFTLELLLAKIKMLQKAGIVKATPNLRESKICLNPTEVPIRKVYNVSVGFCSKIYGYKPKFLFSHFHDFFKG